MDLQIDYADVYMTQEEKFGKDPNIPLQADRFWSVRKQSN